MISGKKGALLAILSLTLLLPFKTRAGEAEPRTVTITAKRFEFSPNQITLKKGEKVKLALISEDVVHGFYLKPLRIDEIIEPGKTTEITVTPQVAGSFTTICDHFCGANHGNMKMTIVVTE